MIGDGPVNNVLAIMGALGGLVVFVGGIWAMLRGIFKQVGATEANTEAVQALTKRMDHMADQVASHGTRLTRLEGRRPPR